MAIEIKHRYSGNVLYTAENAQDVRQALKEAVSCGANLRGANLYGADLYGANLYGANLYGANLYGANLYGADLYGADLRGADLYGADLRGADLRGANLYGADLRGADLYGADLHGADLHGADLHGADLRGANLRGANLRGANLRGANLRPEQAHEWNHALWPVRQDFFSILDQAPSEVAGLREAMLAGQIDGSTYTGECACLCGTIAKVHADAEAATDVEMGQIERDLGIKPSAQRPAERWFSRISEDDKAAALEKLDKDSSEGVYRISVALLWLDEWVASRRAIVSQWT